MRDKFQKIISEGEKKGKALKVHFYNHKKINIIVHVSRKNKKIYVVKYFFKENKLKNHEWINE